MRLSIAACVWWLALAGVAGAQTLDAQRLTVGGSQARPDGTTVRLDGLGTSGGTLVLFTDTDGDVFERLLAASDIPSAFTRRDVTETISSAWTFSGGLLVPNGSAGTPSVRFSGDTNTGLYRVGADSVGVSAGGAVRLTVDTTGTTAAGTLTSTGAFTASGTSTLTGLATFTGNVRATASPFTIRNAANSATIATFGDAGHVLTGTVQASGATTLQSTLAVTGNTTLTGDLAVNGNDITSSGVLRITPTGNLTLDPTGDVVLGPAGDDILPSAGYSKNLGALSNKYLTLHAAELWVETLVAQDTIATIGGRVLVGPTTMLSADLTDVATSITVKHNQMVSGDRVYMEADGKVEFMAITSAAGGSAGAYTYSVTRNLDGSGANLWYAGDAMFNTGQTGNGFLDLYSVRGVKAGSEAGPTIVGNVRLSATFNDWSPRWAIGQLNGLYGYGVSTYGAAFGNPADVWMGVDATNGIRMMEGGTNQRAQFALDGSILLGSASSTNSNTYLTDSAVAIRRGTTNLLLADSVGVRGYDTAGTQKFELSTAAGLIVGETAGNHVLIDTSGELRVRHNATNRITLAASNGAISLFKSDGTIGVRLDATDGITIGDIVTGNQPYLQMTAGTLSFCRTTVFACTLSFDGTTGDMTSTGNILLSTGGNVTSTGEFAFTRGQGLAFSVASSDGDTPRRIQWGTGGTIWGTNSHVTLSMGSQPVALTASGSTAVLTVGGVTSSSGAKIRPGTSSTSAERELGESGNGWTRLWLAPPDQGTMTSSIYVLVQDTDNGVKRMTGGWSGTCSGSFSVINGLVTSC